MSESDHPMIEHRSRGENKAVNGAVQIAIRLGLLALMLTLCLLIVRPFLVAIVWGVIIADAVYPGHRQLLRAAAGRRALASVLFAVLALVVLLGPVVMPSGTLSKARRA